MLEAEHGLRVRRACRPLGGKGYTGITVAIDPSRDAHAVSQRYGQNGHTRGTRWTWLVFRRHGAVGRRNRECAVVARLQSRLGKVTVELIRLRRPPAHGV